MATVDFPGSPALNQQYVFNGRTWFWDGSGWERIRNTVGVASPFTLLSGPFMTATVTNFPVSFTPAAFTLLTHI